VPKCVGVWTEAGLGPAQLCVRNNTWPHWILAVPLSSVTREAVIADGKPRFWEGHGRYQDQSCVGLAGCTIAAVQGDEILDVSGDQCPSLGRRVCEDLIMGESHQGWIGNNRDNVGGVGAELLSDVVRKHLI
jgi:hypothetical protein